jgi:hypothetical protein
LARDWAWRSPNAGTGANEGLGCRVSPVTRDTAVLVISYLAAAGSVPLYVAAVRYRAWFAVWTFGITLFVFGIVAVVEFARLLWETK